MINEIITSIKDAEAKADEIVSSAKEKARENEDAANASLAKADISDASKAKTEFRNATAKTDRAVDEAVEKRKENALASYDATIKEAEKNLDKAVDFLTGEFLKKYVRN